MLSKLVQYEVNHKQCLELRRKVFRCWSMLKFLEQNKYFNANKTLLTLQIYCWEDLLKDEVH